MICLREPRITYHRQNHHEMAARRTPTTFHGNTLGMSGVIKKLQVHKKMNNVTWTGPSHDCKYSLGMRSMTSLEILPLLQAVAEY